jgi:hypothetical protein
VQITSRFKRNPIWLAILVVVILGSLTWKKNLGLDSPDFKVFYTAGKFALEAPEKIYKESPDRYLYPPMGAILFSPFALFDWSVARGSWYILSLGALIWIASRSWAMLFAFIVLARYFSINLRYGQVNVLILMFMMAAHFSRREQISGAYLAFTSTLKIFPGVQAIGFFLQKRWKLLASSIATAIFLLIFPFFFWGMETASSIYLEFPRALTDKGIPVHSHNQSLISVLMRLLYSDSFFIFPVTWAFWRIAEWPLILLKCISFGIGGSLTFFAWKKALSRKLPLDMLSASGFTIIFLSHIVWKPYFIFLLPALAACFASASLLNRQQICFLVAFALMGPFMSAEAYGKYSAYAEGACIHLWSAMMLYFAWIKLREPIKN